ncbi:MAG: hypothetical protein PHQ04_01310 [Opitutaceae bacterium]|nr:hypothetical protein [Opitutaceae bacterium]
MLPSREHDPRIASGGAGIGRRLPPALAALVMRELVDVTAAIEHRVDFRFVGSVVYGMGSPMTSDWLSITCHAPMADRPVPLI